MGNWRLFQFGVIMGCIGFILGLIFMPSAHQILDNISALVFDFKVRF